MVVNVRPEWCPRLEDIVEASRGARVIISEEALDRLDTARRAYLEAVERGERVYGYCTGLGARYSEGVRDCSSGHERRVLEEHAMGVGEPAPPVLVRAFLFVRLVQLSRGRAPVRGVVAERLAALLNEGVTPRIPLYGSVGASGDLAPSAHAFLCAYYGVGEALVGGRWVPCREALEEAGLEVLPLEPGEALALINNTAWSTALAALGIYGLEAVVDAVVDNTASVLGVCGCNPEHYDPRVLEAKAHPGIVEVSNRLEGLSCRGDRLQDPYSLRCTPMILGVARDALRFARSLVEAEACSSPENPVVVDGRVYHWCGFHSVAAGVAGDVARMAAAHVANLVERRIATMLRGDVTGLPEFLAGPEDTVGAMIAQYTAAALAASTRRLSAPASVHSIPTSGLQEDVVPMSPDSGYTLLDTTYRVAVLAGVEAAVARYALEGMPGPSRLRELIDSEVSRILEGAGLGELFPTG